MARAQAVDPVKLFVAALWSLPEALQSARNALQSQWGEVDFESADYAFDSTNYYEPEMGRDLKRRLMAFRALVSPDCLCDAKHACNDIEDRLCGDRGRTVNLDIGYLDHNKIVLASFKGAGQKIYLRSGVWADMVARYRDGRYCPFEWTFPDFRDGRYDSDLVRLRQIYRMQLRAR